MRVIFKREGGFAGKTIRREAEHHDLPPEARNALFVLEELKTPSDGSPERRRDGYRYTFEFERGQEPVVVALNEEHVPTDVMPLVRFFETST